MLLLFNFMFFAMILNSVQTQNVRLVVLTRRHQQLERNFTELGVRDSVTKRNITVKNIIVDNISERKLCNELLSMKDSNILRTYLFDLSENTFVVGQFGRKYALPSVRVSPFYDSTKSPNNDAWKALNKNEREFLITVQTIPAILTNSVTDIARKFSYTKIIVIYDQSFEAAILMHKFDGFEVELISWDRTQEKEIVKKFGDIKLTNSARNNFFVLGSLSNLASVLQRAYECFMFGPSYNWIVITPQTGPVRCPTCVQAKLFHVQPIESRLFDYTSPIDNGNATPSGGGSDAETLSKYFYYDLAQYYARTIDRTVDDNFSILQKCNTRRNWPTKQRFGSNFKSQSNTFHGKFGNFIVGQNSSYQELTLKIDSVRIVNGKAVHNQNVGEWQFEGNNPASFYFKSAIEKQQLSSIPHYRVVTLVDPPFVMQVNDNTTIGNDRFYGYCIDLLREIANQSDFRFSYTLRLTDEDSYGFKNSHGHWNGLVGELQNDRADIAVAPMSVMAEREMAIDYTVPFYDLVGISILMKKPTVQAHLFKFLTVLETSVWFSILGAYLFTSLLLYLFDRYSPYSYKNTKDKHEHDEERREFTMKECLWFCMTSLTPQGGGEAPKNLSGRLVAATWWLFGFIIIASYTANLAAFLTVSRLESPIESLDDLSKQFKIKYSSQRSTSVSVYFERMAGIEEKFYEIWKAMSLNDSLTPEERSKFAVWDYPISDKYTKIWAQMQETGLPRSWVEGVRRVRSEKEQFAFIAKSTHVKYAVMTHCDMQSIGSEFSRKPLALAVQKNSELKERLSRAILKLLNERKLENLKEKWWNQNPEKADCGDTRQSDGISLKNIGGVFVIILIGILIATVTLIVEYIYFRNKLSKQTNHTPAETDTDQTNKVGAQEFGRVHESGNNTNGLSRRTSRQSSEQSEQRSTHAEYGTRRNHQHYYSTNLAAHLHHRQYPRL